jgi:hypothetical protein
MVGSMSLLTRGAVGAKVSADAPIPGGGYAHAAYRRCRPAPLRLFERQCQREPTGRYREDCSLRILSKKCK